ncbi:MAG: YbjQ family protein [Chitinophagaceae bacterium]
MANPKDVLVVTTSSLQGITIKKYLRPISAHIVAGTNLFSDFLGGMTDIFGGRSQTYQKQLTSLYNEAIQRIKFEAYEIGANCIVGLNIDMDEISGKGKSMFMLTAVGTAVVTESNAALRDPSLNRDEKFENVSVDRVNILSREKYLIKNADAGILKMTDDTWSFISTNQVHELFPFVLKQYVTALEHAQVNPESPDNFYKLFAGYIDSLRENKKKDLLYSTIMNDMNEQLAIKLCTVIKELNLFDAERIMALLKADNFKAQKRGLRVVTADKSFYNKEDLTELQSIADSIATIFTERGVRSTKKQLLSSKEKEVWTCECGKTNDSGAYCNGCRQDIYGFKENEPKPGEVIAALEQKIELISEFVA